MQNRIPLCCLLAVIAFIGCNQPAPAPAPAEQSAEHAHVHGAWWCDEHGVPEEVCTRCDPSLVAEFKDKNDWCAEHERPDSQCFICHPELEAKFAAQYEARYGKQPPKPSNEGDKNHDHDHKDKS